MGIRGRDNITKYFNVGFSEEELQKVDAAYKKEKISRGDTKYSFSFFIRSLVVSYIDEKEKNGRKKQERADTQVAVMGGTKKETTWTGYFRGVEKEGNILFPEWG